MLMPGFSFEKISPPERRAAATPTADNASSKKPRGVIVQVLDRIAEARARRSRKEPTASARRKSED